MCVHIGYIGYVQPSSIFISVLLHASFRTIYYARRIHSKKDPNFFYMRHKTDVQNSTEKKNERRI